MGGFQYAAGNCIARAYVTKIMGQTGQLLLKLKAEVIQLISVKLLWIYTDVMEGSI